MKKKHEKVLYFGIGIAGIIALWSIISLFVQDDILFPSPWRVGGEFVSLLSSPSFFPAFLYTALRCILGFLLSTVLAFLFSALAYAYPPLRTILAPFITIFRSTPTMSIIFLVMIWFSPSLSPVFIGFLVIFPLLYESFYNALSGVDKKLIDMSKIYGISNFNRIKNLYLPLTRVGILSGMKSGISLNVKVVISAEVMAYTVKSIGFEMLVSQLIPLTARLFAWTIWAIILSFLFEAIIALILHLTRPKNKIIKT